METPWKMPAWMKAFEPHFQDAGALGVEALMNMYGAKCSARLVEGSSRDDDVLVNRALVANAQVGLLVALKGAGLLRDPAGDADSLAVLRQAYGAAVMRLQELGEKTVPLVAAGPAPTLAPEREERGT